MKQVAITLAISTPLLAVAVEQSSPYSEIPSREICEVLPQQAVRFESGSISVTRKRCIDSMGPDENGFYIYYYDYTWYVFSVDEYNISARTYKEEPRAASFLRLEGPGGARLLSPEDFHRPFLRSVVGYFKDQGINDLEFLDADNTVSGYSRVPVDADED